MFFLPRLTNVWTSATDRPAGRFDFVEILGHRHGRWANHMLVVNASQGEVVGEVNVH